MSSLLTADEVIQKLCRLQQMVTEHIGYESPADCFCGKGGFWNSDGYNGTIEGGYRNDGTAIDFITAAIEEKISADECKGLTDLEKELLEALEESDKTLCVLQWNIADANKSDSRWDGVWGEIERRRNVNVIAIAKAKGQL